MRKPDLRTLIPSVGIAIGAVAAGFGVHAAVTGRDAQHLPDVIERVDPALGSTQVPRQTSVTVELEAGYAAELTIDGTVLPTTDVDDFNAANPEPGQMVAVPPTAILDSSRATITYEPSDAGLVKRFGPGVHDATVVYWKETEGRERSLSYSWTFTVV